MNSNASRLEKKFWSLSWSWARYDTHEAVLVKWEGGAQIMKSALRTRSRDDWAFHLCCSFPHTENIFLHTVLFIWLAGIYSEEVMTLVSIPRRPIKFWRASPATQNRHFVETHATQWEEGNCIFSYLDVKYSFFLNFLDILQRKKNRYKKFVDIL